MFALVKGARSHFHDSADFWGGNEPISVDLHPRGCFNTVSLPASPAEMKNHPFTFEVLSRLKLDVFELPQWRGNAMTLPELTFEQRQAALEKATAARRRRADVKAALKKREMTLPEVFELAETDEAVAKMRVIALLGALPRIGSHRAHKIMEDVGIAESRRIRGLGPIQKAALIKHFA